MTCRGKRLNRYVARAENDETDETTSEQFKRDKTSKLVSIHPFKVEFLLSVKAYSRFTKIRRVSMALVRHNKDKTINKLSKIDSGSECR